MESRLNSSGTASQDSDTLQLCGKVKDLLSRLRETPENFTGIILFYVDVQRHFLWNERQ